MKMNMLLHIHPKLLVFIDFWCIFRENFSKRVFFQWYLKHSIIIFKIIFITQIQLFILASKFLHFYCFLNKNILDCLESLVIFKKFIFKFLSKQNLTPIQKMRRYCDRLTPHSLLRIITKIDKNAPKNLI